MAAVGHRDYSGNQEGSAYLLCTSGSSYFALIALPLLRSRPLQVCMHSIPARFDFRPLLLKHLQVCLKIKQQIIILIDIDLSVHCMRTIRYDTIEEFNVDSKAEYAA